MDNGKSQVKKCGCDKTLKGGLLLPECTYCGHRNHNGRICDYMPAQVTHFFGDDCLGGHYEKVIFVFGSNLAGIHGAGSAKAAKFYHDAKPGIGIGLTGNAYAIPTKDHNLLRLDLDTIQGHVSDFLKFAAEHLNWKFNVVKIGCGLAGYNWKKDIEPMFKERTNNVVFI